MDEGRAPGQTAPAAAIATLVARARDGDTDAAWELLQVYRPLLARTIRRAALARSGALRLFDPDDLWQEAGYAFLLGLRRYEPDRRVPFGGYVKVALPWHFHDLARRAEPEGVALDADGEELAALLADPDGDFVAALALRDLLARLSARQARVLEEIYHNDRPAAEVARDLGVTTRAVERTRRRAEEEVRAVLARDEAPRLRLVK